MISYALLLAAALALNAREHRMLALTLVVGAGIFAPIPDALFYLICMLVELLVGLVAYRIAAPASWLIVRMSAMLFVLHALGWWLDGYPAASPYHVSVRLLEHAELLFCCFFSEPIKKRFYHV